MNVWSARRKVERWKRLYAGDPVMTRLLQQALGKGDIVHAARTFEHLALLEQDRRTSAARNQQAATFQRMSPADQRRELAATWAPVALPGLVFREDPCFYLVRYPED